MKSKNASPPRPVPVLTASQEALLSAITVSKRFTLAAAMTRAAGAVRLCSMRDTLDAADPAMNSTLEPKDASNDSARNAHPLARYIGMISRNDNLREPLRLVIKKHGKTMREMMRQSNRLEAKSSDNNRRQK